jgi:hypothetical protein
VSDATFTPYTAEDPGLPMLSLASPALTLHVPERAWTCLLSWEPGDAGFALTMVDKATKDVFAIAPLIGDAPMADVFATGTATAEGEAATKKLFGGAPTLSDLLEVAFRTNAGAYRCTPGAENDGLALAVALVVTIAGLPIASEVAAHRVGDKRLLLGKSGSGAWKLVADFPFKSSMYRVDASSLDRRFVAAVAHGVARGQAGMPAQSTLGPECAAMWLLVYAPSHDQARVLRDEATRSGKKPLVDALDAYLGSGR